ncbi:MAG: sulfatase-like hydrolase/transferase [Deltaproteobacteria bacterium]|nr:sulfatase-like hydrolase/transferase [Deltaproteobacteria bacterium]
MSQAPAARYSRWTDSQLFAASLVAPIFGYSLLLQILRISERGRFLIASGEVSWLTGVALLGSTFAFNVGLGLFCAVLLLVRDQGRKRWIFTGLVLQAIGLLFSTTETIAYVYFLQTGDALDWPLLAHMFRQLDDLKLVLAGDVSVIQWFQLAFAIAVACAAPWLVRAWSRRWKLPPYPGKERRSRARARVAFTLSVPVAALGLLPPVVKVNDTQLVRHPVLVVLETMVHGLDYGDATVDEAMAAGRFYSPDLTISKIPGARQRNLVIILLESTRASATTPYRPDLETTPFLAEIARKSLMIDRAYAVIPSTAKAITATLCSLYPSTSLEPRALTTGLLGRCLPQLLREQATRRSTCRRRTSASRTASTPCAPWASSASSSQTRCPRPASRSPTSSATRTRRCSRPTRPGSRSTPRRGPSSRLI